jgi:type IV pilus assembly protein PilQ
MVLIMALGCSVQTAQAQGRGLETKISLKAKNQDLAKVMANIARFTGVNILVAPQEASRKITINIKNIPALRAMELISKLNSLQLRAVDDDQKVWVIAPTSIIEKEFEAGLTEPVTLSFAAASKMQGILQKALSKSGNVTIEVDDRTNTLIVSGTKVLIESTKKLIRQLDKPVPQVLIDSKIVSVSTTVLKDIGFNWDWGTGFNTDGADGVEGAGGSGPLLTVSERQKTNFNADFYQSGADGAPLLQFGDFFRGNLFFDAVFRALETNSIARSLASPRLLAVNGAKATLDIGDEIVYSGGPSQGPEKAQTGIRLQVEPLINKDGFITLDVQVEQSTPKFDRADFPTISKTTATTKVQVRDGEEVLIGGLVTENNTHTEEKIPFLSDIPLIKHLFIRKKDNPITQELVILLTPRVIKQAVPGIGEEAPSGPIGGGDIGDDDSLGDDDLGGDGGGDDDLGDDDLLDDDDFGGDF